MNKKVYPTMLILCTVFLLASNIIKNFIPSYFELVITNENLLRLGNLIDNNIVLFFIFGAFFSTLTYWLYFSSCCKRLITERQHFIVFVAFFISYNIVSLHDENIASFMSMLIMILYPVYLKAKCKDIAFVFVYNLACQWLVLNIRNLSAGVSESNSVFSVLIGFEMYIWLIILLIYQIKFKEVNVWEVGFHHFSEKTQAFISTNEQKLKKKLRVLKKKLRCNKLLSKNAIKHWLNSERKATIYLWYRETRVKVFLYALTLCFMYLIAFVTNKYIELIYFAIAHTIIREIGEKPYHDEKTHICLLITGGVIFLGGISLMPISVNILYSIPFAFLIAWVGYLVVNNIEYQKEKKLTLEAQKLDLTLDKIQNYFKEFKTVEKYKEYLIYVLIDKNKDSDYFKIHDDIIDTQQYRNYKCSFLKKIKKSNDLL